MHNPIGSLKVSATLRLRMETGWWQFACGAANQIPKPFGKPIFNPRDCTDPCSPEICYVSRKYEKKVGLRMKMEILKHRPKASTMLFSAVLLIAGTTGAHAAEYDSNTKVHVDGLWFRVHAEDCPELILKEEKKTMTLEEADKAGARIGESGQSGRTNCCLQGYKRKFPEK